jgi:hypothetical protein
VRERAREGEERQMERDRGASRGETSPCTHSQSNRVGPPNKISNLLSFEAAAGRGGWDMSGMSAMWSYMLQIETQDRQCARILTNWPQDAGGESVLMEDLDRLNKRCFAIYSSCVYHAFSLPAHCLATSHCLFTAYSLALTFPLSVAPHITTQTLPRLSIT